MINHIQSANSMVELYEFGSTVRGDDNVDSDRDILALVDDENIDFDRIVGVIKNYDDRCDVSIYSYSRIHALFEQGDLFGWHLYLERRPIYSPRTTPYLDTLGEPAPYDKGAEDMAAIRSVADELALDEYGGCETLIYDAGLLLVIVRNAGVIATAVTSSRPDFSHSSWLSASTENGIDPPLTPEEYRVLRSCRQAVSGTAPPPEVFAGFIREALPRVLIWLPKMECLVSSHIPRP